MDGESIEPVGWHSSIPGVSQRDGAPASLGLAGRGVHSPSVGAGEQRGGGGSPIGPAGDGRSGGRRRGRVVPWRALVLAVVSLAAIVGVGRAAGVDAGVAPGTLDSTWGPPAAGDGSTLEAGGGSAVMPDPVGTSSPGSPTQGVAAPVAEPGDESPDWSKVLAELDARRVLTLTEMDPGLLSTYAQPGSTAWEEDSALLADLSGRGVRPQGLASRILAVEGVDADSLQARLRVVDVRTGYSMVDTGGAVVQEVEPAGPRRWTVTLSRLSPAVGDPDPAGPEEFPEASAEPTRSAGLDPGWRVSSVAPVLSGESTGIDDDGTTSSAVDDIPAGGTP